ncbi:PaaI family thioesterase [Thermodesulfobacteriota bacterium]
MEFSVQNMKDINNNTLYKTVGIFVEKARNGQARSSLRPNKDLCWPFEGQPHGGVLFTLMDTTMAWAVLTGVEEGYNCATINLDIQYTGRALGGIFFCHSRIIQKGSRIVYARADIFDENESLIAAGQGSFRIVRSPYASQN